MNAVDLCASLRGSLPELFHCEPAVREGVRVRTPFLYPDGDFVDVFVVERKGSLVVTDFGEALGWLRMQSVRSRGQLSPKQRRMVNDVCLTLSVELHRGQLRLGCESPKTLGEFIHRLGQAVVRVSDLWFTMRTRSGETVTDEVTDWLEEREVLFERGVKRRGRSGRQWTIDYETVLPSRTSLVFLLSAGSRAAATRVTEHVASGCLDLYHLATPELGPTLVSLFDDTGDVWRDEDFKLVESLSEVAMWSRPDEFERILTAA